MAKKVNPDAAEPLSLTERLLQMVEAEYGQDVAQSGKYALDRPCVKIPVSPSLDAILGGGIYEGSWVGITGAPKTGKTSTALCIARNAQKAEFGLRPVFYAKIEGRLSPELLNGTEGLDLSRGRFTVITSQEGRILSAQDYLQIISKIIETVPGAVVIIDSISALCDTREIEGGIGTETRGATAKLVTQFLRLNNQIVPVQRSIVIGITHQIANTSGMGPPKVEKSPEGWRYAKDYDLVTKTKTLWKHGERVLGLQVKWLCNTTKSGTPGASIDSYVRFGRGVDEVYELLQFAVAFGLVKQNKAWLTLEFVGSGEADGPPKFCGAEATWAALRSRPDWVAALTAQVNQRLKGSELETGEE